MTNPSHLLLFLAIAGLGVLLVALWQSLAGSAERSEAVLAGAVLVVALLLVTVPPALSVWTQGPAWPTYANAWPAASDTMQKYLGYAVLLFETVSIISVLGARCERRRIGISGVLLLSWQAIWLLSTQSQGQQVTLFLFLLPGLALVLLKSRLAGGHVLSIFLGGAFAVCSISVAAGMAFPERFTVPPNRTFAAFFSGRLVGLIDDPNLLGAVASVLIIGAAFRWRGTARVAAVATGVLTIAFADSRSALVAAAAAAAAGTLRWLLAHRDASSQVSLWTATALTTGALGVVLALNNYLGSQTDLSTLDGRTQIWDALVGSVDGSRLVGLGAAAFTSLQSEGIVGSSIGSGHNAWIDAYVHAGAIGLTLMVALQLVLGVKAFRSARVDNGLSFALFVLLITRSVSEPQITTGFLAWNSLITVLLIVVVPEAVSPANRRAKERVSKMEVPSILDGHLRTLTQASGGSTWP
jgi:hypothetical protein